MAEQNSGNEPTGHFAEVPKIANIEILSLLGKGGMSLVYKARQRELNRIVAVKVLARQTEAGIKRFQKEAKLTSSLNHPNIVKTISFGVSENSQPYLVMEYLEGASLADEMKNNGRLKLQKFRDVFMPALSALDHAHQAGLVHRDIKPGNIMLCRNDLGDETVKIVDFGIAKVTDEAQSKSPGITSSCAILGSPAYMSPEQCQGKSVDNRSDLYSMACVMYETLRGEPPFTAASAIELMQKHSIAAPPTVSELSRQLDIRKELAEVTLWGLAKDPSERPQSASEFAKKLNAVLERITLDKVPRLIVPGIRGSLSKSLPLVLIALALVAASASIVWFQLRQHTLAVVNKIEHQQKKVAALSVDEKIEKQLKEKLARIEKKYGENSIKGFETISELGDFYLQKHKYAQAIVALRQAKAIADSKLSPNNAAAMKNLALLARALEHEHQWSECEDIVKIILKLRTQATSALYPATLDAQFWLADCYFNEHKYKEAEALHKATLESFEKTVESHSWEVQRSLEAIAACYEKNGNDKQALSLRQRAKSLQEWRELYNPDKVININQMTQSVKSLQSDN